MSWGDRVGCGLGLLAVLIAFAVSVWGIGGPFPDGHYASTSVIGTAAYNTYRWKTLFPVEVYVDHSPPSSVYYMHHPLGMFGIVKTLVGYFAASVSQKVDVENSMVRLVLGFFFFFFHQLFYWVLSRALLGESLDFDLQQTLVLAVLNAIVAVPLYRVLDRLKVTEA